MADNESQTILTLTSDIVSAHLSNNKVSPGDVASLIANVHAALTGVGKKAPEALKSGRAVSIKSSLKPDILTCLECGMKAKILKRHLQTSHGLTPIEYRRKWGLPASYPMVSPNYAATRSELAVQMGFGRKKNGKGGPKPAGGKPRTTPPK